MGDYNKNRFRERWLRGDLNKNEPQEKKDKKLDEFENKEEKENAKSNNKRAI